ncbi:MAG: DNA polymerase III subunit alpha [Sedimentisphaerales bacterium]|nr:DNA polymerase III subunit alpha [Sedimentisphaerales bacterium]
MAKNGFTHLHLHSQYSLLDGAITFDRLFKRCAELGMDSVAVTDHGNMFGAVEFYSRALSAHIKPIIGIEAYMAPASRFDKTKTSISDAAYHLVLLAENNTGYKNLLKLASTGYTEGFYYRPRIDKEILTELSDGLIATSACIKGELAALLSRGDEAGAKAVAESYLKIFGPERFFVEIQIHADDDPDIRQGLVELARSMGLGLVATNDVHFLKSQDYEAHNCLCCISTGKNFEDPTRMIYPKDIFLKSPKQMRALFEDYPQACDNTVAIAERCNVELDLKSRHAPGFEPADGSSPEAFLTKVCYENARRLYGNVDGELKKRLDRELEVIESKGFASYFLIVWDFCNFAHKNHIPVGARGSAVGAVVGYCLGLSNVDPVKYDLLFERFMDPERNEMPDIDIDICQDGRSKIIDYVRQKYGHVAQIITFGTMKARAVIRDVCRVLGVALSEADRLAKLVPDSLGMTLEKALKTEPQLREACQRNEHTRKVIDICKKLEGLARHASVHAAGVVIADKPLTDFLPLYKASDSDEVVTQFEGPMVEKVGLLKMDFLGLKTLSVLERSRQLVKEIHGRDIDIESIGLDEPQVFELFASGRTKGVFQFESGGMQDLLMKMKPDRIEDLIAANALFRPGPMTLIGDYIDRKHGLKWQVPHPIMKEVLEETYGIMVYQEQVMRICNRLGGIPLREAYTLIKAISKKKARTIAKEKERFISGCINKGLSRKQSEENFELIKRFAGYGFNKSHSTRYAIIAYQTAYMKVHWPLEFMAALLTYEMGSTDKVVDYIRECGHMGIEVSAPDINESGVNFTPLYTDKVKKGTGVLRFGLAAVKGVGQRAVEQIIEARKRIGQFQSLFNFCENVDLRLVNKQVSEALIKAGAFNRLGGNRAQMLVGLEKAMQIGMRAQSDRQSGQLNLFSASGAAKDFSKDAERLPQAEPWPEAQMLAYEKQVLGFYVTSNPLSHYAETINSYSTHNSSQLKNVREGQIVTIGGMITKKRYHIIKKGSSSGSRMAVFTLEDLQGQVEVVLFPDTLSRYAEEVVEDNVVFVRGKIDFRREKPNILAAEIIRLTESAEKLAAKVRINLDAKEVTKETVARIQSVCRGHRGSSPLYISVRTGKGVVCANAGQEFSIKPDVDFCRKMKQLVGPGNLQLMK